MIHWLPQCGEGGVLGAAHRGERGVDPWSAPESVGVAPQRGHHDRVPEHQVHGADVLPGDAHGEPVPHGLQRRQALKIFWTHKTVCTKKSVALMDEAYNDLHRNGSHTT